MSKVADTTLHDLASHPESHQALCDLFNALEEDPQNISRIANAETRFIMAAAHVTGELSSDQTSITGSEEMSHRFLHHILTQESEGKLGDLKDSLSL